MGETRDRLLDQAKGYTRDAVDMGKQVARVAADTVKSEVERQGLTPPRSRRRSATIGREAEQALKSEAERVAPEPLKATGTMLGGGAGQPTPGGAAGRGMSAGFASTQTATRDVDATVPERRHHGPTAARTAPRSQNVVGREAGPRAPPLRFFGHPYNACRRAR